MRYPDGGGPRADERVQLEQIRLEAADLIEAGGLDQRSSRVRDGVR
jgi:hypothetical protein